MKFVEVLENLISRFNERNIELVLTGGLALSTMNIFRFTNDLDFIVLEECKYDVHEIMSELDYELQDFSNDEIRSYFSPLKVFGQVDFMMARRKYTRAMVRRASVKPLFDSRFYIKTVRPEDLIGLKVQAIHNDPENRFLKDAPDIRRLLEMHSDKLDMDLVREYFRVFDKEEMLYEWLGKINR